MDKVIKKLQEKSMSGYDLMKLVDYKANMMTINSLVNYDNIDDVLGYHEAVIFLYESKPMYGHWVCLYKVDENTLFFFDPYGLAPDQQIEFAKYSKPYLSKLLNESDYDVYYNKKDIQKLCKNVSTCGKFVGFKIIMRDIDHDKFLNLFLNNKHYDPDFWISALMSFL